MKLINKLKDFLLMRGTKGNWNFCNFLSAKDSFAFCPPKLQVRHRKQANMLHQSPNLCSYDRPRFVIVQRAKILRVQPRLLRGLRVPQLEPLWEVEQSGNDHRWRSFVGNNSIHFAGLTNVLNEYDIVENAVTICFRCNPFWYFSFFIKKKLSLLTFHSVNATRVLTS